MDGALILTAKPGYTVTQIRDWIDQLAVAYWQGQGYTVVQNPGTGKYELIGKNAATGQDTPNAAHTITWSDVQTAPDGTEYIPSLSSDPRFVDWKTTWAEAGLPDAFTEIVMPPEWVQEGE